MVSLEVRGWCMRLYVCVMAGSPAASERLTSPKSLMMSVVFGTYYSTELRALM